MIFFLSGCNTIERKLLCQQIKDYTIKPIPMCDVSFQFARCRCRCFDYNNWEALPLNKCERFQEERPSLISEMDQETKKRNQVEVVDFNIGYCDGIGGFFAADAAQEVRPNIKALADVKKDYCGK
jgi:hypothetical protein